MALVLKSKKTMDMIEENKKKGGGNQSYFKPEYDKKKGIMKVFICPPKSEDVPLVQKAIVHEIFNQTGKVAGVVSPANFEEKDPFIKLGWALRKKYADHKSAKVKDFFKNLVGKDKNILYIIDPADTEKGIQMWQAPKAIIDFILTDVEENDGDMDFAHPVTGKCLVVKKVGEKLNTKYTCGWSKKDVELEGIDEDKLEELLADIPDSVLGSLFKKPTKDEIEDYKEAIDTLAEKLGIAINWKDTKNSNLEVDDDADVDDDEDDDGDEDLDLDEDEEDTKKSKSKKTEVKKDVKKTDSKKSSKKEVDEDEEDDLDLDDDEEEDTKKSKTKKTEVKKDVKKDAKKTTKKTVVDDEDDLDLDEEDDLDLDEE